MFSWLLIGFVFMILVVVQIACYGVLGLVGVIPLVAMVMALAGMIYLGYGLTKAVIDEWKR